MNLKGLDTYIIVDKALISNNDKVIINSVYMPLIGYHSVALYFYLINSLEKFKIMTKEETFNHLIANLQMDLINLEENLKKLEAIGLLKTYVKDTNYVFEIYKPLTLKELFNHPLITPLLYYNLGKSEYEKLVSFYLKPEINLTGYKNITHQFSEVFSVIDDKIQETTIIEGEKNKVELGYNLDFDLLLSSLPKSLYNKNTFKEEEKYLINTLSYLYKIDILEMTNLLRETLNNNHLDVEELKRKARVLYNFNNMSKPTMIYQKEKPINKSKNMTPEEKALNIFESVSPYEFLRSKYKTGEPSARELKIIENIMLNFKFSPSVVNVLISYVLKIDNAKFNRHYVEAIASQWGRLNVKTAQEAMEVCKREYNKNHKTKTKNIKKTKTKEEEKVPDWYTKEVEKEKITNEEAENMENLLNSV